MKRELTDLFEKYIRGTEEKAIVVDHKLLLCHMSAQAVRGADLKTPKVYLSMRVLKHLYDKRPSEEFDALVGHLHAIAKTPDHIYQNKAGKRGSICLVKMVRGKGYICSLETVSTENKKAEPLFELHIVTAFRQRDENYLRDYKLLWSRRIGSPHRN